MAVQDNDSDAALGPIAGRLAELSSTGLWTIRVFIVAALAATVFWAGPRAKAVLAARLHGEGASQGEPVAVNRLGLLESPPSWLAPDLLRCVLADLEPRMGESFGIADEAAAGALLVRLRRSPWIARAELTRRYPDRLGLTIDLRRPELLVFEPRNADLPDPNGEASASEPEGFPPIGGETNGSNARPRAWVDGTGHVLPFPDLATVQSGFSQWIASIPRTVLHPLGGTGIRIGAVTPGVVHPDPRVVATAAVSVEYRDEFAKRLAGAPQLLEVDAGNLDGGIDGFDPFQPEVRLILRRNDGAGVSVGYGRDPGTGATRISHADKRAVLAGVLGTYPGLVGLEAVDLRFRYRWRDYLRPRPPELRDPWPALSTGNGAVAPPKSEAPETTNPQSSDPRNSSGNR